MGLSGATRDLLRCPACRSALATLPLELRCAGCGRGFPLTAGGIPVLIDEDQSVFTISGFLRETPTFFRRHGLLVRLLRPFVPDVSAKPKTRGNLVHLQRLLVERGRPVRVLVVGGSIRGLGLDALMADDIELVETDVALGPFTSIICDAHSIPFADQSFDAVIAQCVLEHVIDPAACTAEFHRVLVSGGFVYAETAFVQQVHGGAFDFCRFTELGHRRLFRHFRTIESGAVSGPGTVLAWSYEYLLLALVPAKSLRNWVKAFARISGFFIKYLDYWLIERDAALDGASAVYFLGARSERPMDDRELLATYRGND